MALRCLKCEIQNILRNMKNMIAALLSLSLLLPTPPADARDSHNRNYAQGVQRDKHGRIARSSSAKTQFKKTNPCPSTGKSSGACSGYVIDHIKALKRGGEDKPSNMQWQTKHEAKEKDKIE